jgi:ABC-2 family transporter
MTALVRTELLKLTTTRTPWLLGAGAIALATASAVFTVAGAGRRQAPSIGTTGLVLDLLAGYGRGALVAMVLGTLVATTEYRHDTITSTLLCAPRRAQVAAAKALLVAGATAALGLLGLLAVLGVGLAGQAVTPALLSPHLAAHCLGLVAAYPAYGLLGLGVGMLLPRYDALAAILPAAWVLFLEDLLLGSFTRHLPEWTLTRVSAAAADALDLAPTLPVWAGFAGLAGYAVASWALGAAWFLRSDVA